MARTFPTDSGNLVLDTLTVTTVVTSGNLTVGGDLAVTGDTTLVDTTTSGKIIFDTGVAVTGANYEIARNADATNRLQFNAPTGSIQEWSFNDVSAMALTASALFVAQAANPSSGNNSTFTFGATGSTISRNIADANPCLIVQQLDAGSTGDVLQVKNDSVTLLTVAQDGNFTFVPEAGSKLTLAVSAVTQTDGVFDVDVTTGTANVVGIDCRSSLTADVDGLTSISGSTVGPTGGGGSGNTQQVFAAEITGSGSDTDHSYAAYVAMDANKSGGTSEMTAYEVGTGYDAAMFSSSGDLFFDAYSVTLARFDESNVSAGTEAVGLHFGDAGTRTWDTGAVTAQREFVFNEPTYAFAGASTIATAATVFINDAPIAGANATITDAYALLVVSGSSRFDGRVLLSQGADVASANDLTLGADGNTFEITGTTQINAITTAGWQNGTMITLLFTSTPTVKHNTAGGGGTAVMLLAGAADFSATAGDTLTLILSEIGGTQAWREIARAAI